ncbi:MAG: carbohydrate ABC transporter permease [Bdellovibrionia bacterium]
MRRSDNLFAWLLLLPTLVVLGVFVFYPAINSFYLSLHEVEAFSTHKTFIGLDNYKMLLESPQYWQSIQATISFILLTVIPSVILSLAFAIGIDANPYFRGLLRTIFLMPVAISSAMAAMLWIFFYNPTSGYINYVLEIFGARGPNWLGDGRWAVLAVAIVTVWKEIGFSVIFFLAGLAAIPSDIREAAALDGANAWQRFWQIVLPMLSPTVLFVTVVSVINSFQSFGQIHILTQGGPAGATSTLVYNLYRDAFQNFQTGSASAQAVILFLIMLAATAVQFWVAKKRIHYS